MCEYEKKDRSHEIPSRNDYGGIRDETEIEMLVSDACSVGKSAMEQPDGYLFVCRLCGDNHEVPKQYAPYWSARVLCNIRVGEIELGCAGKPGVARYSFANFKPYRMTAA